MQTIPNSKIITNAGRLRKLYISCPCSEKQYIIIVPDQSSLAKTMEKHIMLISTLNFNIL